MRVTVITACFNAERTLPTAMESVLRQKGVETEYVVVDGASGDGTVGVVKSFEPRFGGRMRWISEPDEGLYDAFNKGIAMATGDIVGILNADDALSYDSALADIAAMFAPSVDAAYADIRFVRPDDGAEGVRGLDQLLSRPTFRYYSGRRWRPWMHGWGFMPPHPSLYVRREVFARLGGYRTDYRISADFELMTRFLCRARISARYLPQCVVTMRMGGVSTRGWRSTLLLNRENVRANRENGYFCCLPMMLPKYAFKIWGLRPWRR